MGNLSLGGLISGANTDSIIQKILDAESLRIKTQRTRKASLADKQSAWRKVRSSLQTLQSKLDAIRFPSIYRSRKTTLTDDTIATSSASSGATLTTHSLTVSTLAQSHVVAGNSTQTSPNNALNLSGTITLNGQAISVATGDTLNSLRDKINTTANVNVTAEVVKVMNGTTENYRLVLTSKQQGTAGAVTMTDNQTGTLLQNLGFKNATTGAWLNQLALAQDATFTLDGVSYTKSTNVISDIIPNLSITLKKAGTTNITVSQDTDQPAKAVQDWVDALNATISLLKEQTNYDSTTKQGGALSGDSLARNILTHLRSEISNVVGGLPADLNQMSQVGVTTGAWGSADYGKVLLDTTKLKAKLDANPDGVALVFGALRTNVALATNGATAAASSTAAGSFAAADVINGDTDGNRFASTGGGWQSAGVPSATVPETLTVTLNGTKMIDQIELYIPDTATYSASAAGLKDYKVQYLGTDSVWHDLSTVTNHSGSYKLFEFNAVQASAVRLSVTATYGTNNPARVTELKVNEVNNGSAIDMYRYLKGTLESGTGPIDSRDANLSAQMQKIDQQITKMNDQLATREETLRKRFAIMEQALARIQSQGGALLMQMTGAR